MESGVPEQIGGVWVGFTDFSEFALQAPGALPAGFTLRGNAFPNAPNSFAIVSDVTVGRYFSMNGQDTSNWGISLDAFNNLALWGEFVARIWVATNTGNRRLIGPGIMSADAAATWDASVGKVFKRSSIDFESEIGTIINGSAGQVATADLREAEQAGVWIWCRYRNFPGNPNTTDGALLKHWYGNYSDEPRGWDVVNGSYSRPVAAIGSAFLGWVMQAVGNPDEQRISYFAFTENPNISIVPPPGGFPEPPPASGDVEAPTVDAVSPLQATYVGLRGSPFTTVP